jgi:hypothetical protein
MPEQLTGPQLFLRYAFPCAEDQLRANKISHTDFKNLEWLISNIDVNKQSPKIFFLRKCFPNAVQSLERFATENNREVWLFKTVAEFWRYHHGHTGECAVRRLVVFGIGGEIINIDSPNAEMHLYKKMINLYRLSLKVGDSIIVHRRIVIEKIE